VGLDYDFRLMTQTSRTTVLTGVKPTGQPHIGNYLGAIRPALELSAQPNTETWFFIADYHALINVPEPERMREMTYEVAAAWLACGLDPSTTVFYRQSDVPEIMELNWILSCFTPKGLMNRAHAYKARVQENEAAGKSDLDFGVSMGLYGYPVLMAADILMFSADKVPVGEDQVQHLEIARDIAQKFNRRYGELLKLPGVITQIKGKNVPGLDGRKMSKSYDNYIHLFEEPARMKKLVARIKTDSLPPEAPKSTEGSILFELYECFASPEQVTAMRERFTAGISWGVAKEELFNVMNEHLSLPREKYKELMADRSYIDKLLKEGAERARAKAVPFMKTLRQAMGMD
jgi:tryptophanyl-tRNA synthetase